MERYKVIKVIRVLTVTVYTGTVSPLVSGKPFHSNLITLSVAAWSLTSGCLRVGREPRIDIRGQLEGSDIAAGVKYCAEPSITVVASVCS